MKRGQFIVNNGRRYAPLPKSRMFSANSRRKFRLSNGCPCMEDDDEAESGEEMCDDCRAEKEKKEEEAGEELENSGTSDGAKKGWESRRTLVRAAAKRAGHNLSDAEIDKHSKILHAQHGDGGNDDEYGQGFYDAAKEYFANSGTSEGAKKGWMARKLGKNADAEMEKAESAKSIGSHLIAHEAALSAADAYRAAGMDDDAQKYLRAATKHADAAGKNPKSWSRPKLTNGKPTNYSDVVAAIRKTSPIRGFLNSARETVNALRRERMFSNTTGIAVPFGDQLNNRFALPSDGWIHIAPFGNHPHPTGVLQVVDRKAVDTIVQNFKRKKQDANFPGLLVDYDHLSQQDGNTTEAAGWIDDLSVRNNGLWGRVRWTDSGEKAVNGGRFRMVSPVWKKSECEKIDNKVLRPLVLDSVAITNEPNIKGMVPLTK
jgi:hypothetical protein